VLVVVLMMVTGYLLALGESGTYAALEADFHRSAASEGSYEEALA
jgi:hypothetical protein